MLPIRIHINAQSPTFMRHGPRASSEHEARPVFPLHRTVEQRLESIGVSENDILVRMRPPLKHSQPLTVGFESFIHSEIWSSHRGDFT